MINYKKFIWLPLLDTISFYNTAENIINWTTLPWSLTDKSVCCCVAAAPSTYYSLLQSFLPPTTLYITHHTFTNEKGDGNVRFSGQMRQLFRNLKSYFHEILHGGWIFFMDPHTCIYVMRLKFWSTGCLKPSKYLYNWKLLFQAKIGTIW